MDIELVLTRRVIIEKVVSFAHYRNPDDVPDDLWRRAFLDKELDRTNHHNICSYIAGKILAPMIQSDNWCVSPTIYNPQTFVPAKQIIFHGIRGGGFTIGIELINDITLYFKEEDYTLLKYTVMIAWGMRNLRSNI